MIIQLKLRWHQKISCLEKFCKVDAWSWALLFMGETSFSSRFSLTFPKFLHKSKSQLNTSLPLSESNEKFTKSLIKKLDIFRNNKCKFKIVWNTRDIRSLFHIRDNVKHYSCIIYAGNVCVVENMSLNPWEMLF